MSAEFTKCLLNWNKDQNDRPMPWKGEKDPYKIWLSEVILQQTRVEQGWMYYEKFVRNFPSIFHLAKAKEEKVLKLWEGLGYYNRCKNLLFTAKEIVNKLNGNFPNTYANILNLKGVGPYTAAAIASFAFNLPFAVVDGNVFRVLSRYYGIDIPIDSKEGKLLFNELAQKQINKQAPGLYNQALMDFGATVCKPFAPLCATCCMQNKCVAFNVNKVNLLPIKNKSIQKKKRFFDFYCFEYNGKWMVQKRTNVDIWNGLYQFYLVEQEKLLPTNASQITSFINTQLGIHKTHFKEPILVFSPFKQQLTHQTIEARYIVLELTTLPPILQKAKWVSKSQLKKLPFPKLINVFLEQDFKKI